MFDAGALMQHDVAGAVMHAGALMHADADADADADAACWCLDAC